MSDLEIQLNNKDKNTNEIHQLIEILDNLNGLDGLDGLDNSSNCITTKAKIEYGQNSIYFVYNDDVRPLESESIYMYIESICQKMNLEHLDIDKIVSNVYPKLKTMNTFDDINDQIVSSASDMATDHYDYPNIGVCILVNNMHKNTHENYLDVANQLYTCVNKKGELSPIISDSYYNFIKEHYEKINAIIRYDRDYEISVFGFRTLEKAYLKKEISGRIIERPQHLYMRVAIALHYRNGDFSKILESYEYLSRGYFVHATPTLFNAGTNREQLSSCFLLGIEDDMAKIGECWKNSAIISKYSGGLGLHATNIRCNGAYIYSTQGKASGLKLLTVFNQIARYADQGGKRAGSIAIFIELWHADIFYFLELKKNTGAETERARDLFLGLMVNDIFMKRVLEDDIWTLMCPSECPNLLNKFGKEFTSIYIDYESKGKYIKQIRARDLWFKLMETQIETGVPYIVFKDAVNYKSNQINIGVVNGSNLCVEIVEVSSSTEYAICNLASICLPKYIKTINNVVEFDHNELYKVTRIITRNLNNIIDINFYPVEETKSSNLKHRPIGIGVQGLADVFAIFKTPFDSPLARKLNKEIFETIYFAAMTESMELAKKYGPYETFQGSPLSQGKFQFDLWENRTELSGRWDWDGLMTQILIHGARNSLLTAVMPTATTSQIMNNNEACEPYTENIYTRTTLAGDHYVTNKHMMKDLMKLGLWNNDIIDLIKYYKGSLEKIMSIPDDIKMIYRTVWNIPQKSIIEMAADRGLFIDQTQSMNIFIDKPTFAKLNACLFYAWEKGLKTGMYYLRTKAASNAKQFGINMSKIQELEKQFDQSSLTNHDSDSDSDSDADADPHAEIPSCKWEPGCLSCHC